MSAPLEDGWEYGFESPITGLMYVTTNPMLADTIHSARPEVPLLRRRPVDWERVR